MGGCGCSIVEGHDRNARCKPGQRMRFVVRCKDRLGNRVRRGGLGLTARGASREGRSIPCKVRR